MKFDIITIGDAFEDVFVEPDLRVKSDARMASGKGICFEFGEKIPLNWVKYEIGGSACNGAVGLSRLGFKTSILTLLGDDTPMTKIIDRLEKEGVDKTNITISNNLKTGFSVIFSNKGERTIFVYHGVKDYNELRIKKSMTSKWFFVTPLASDSGEIEKLIVAQVSEHGAKFAWNPGSQQINQGASHFAHLLKCCTILFLNREEAIKFVNLPARPQIEDVMKKLHNFGAKIVVVTNGKEGAMAFDGSEFYRIEANKNLDKVDTTGAGDAFAIGFLGRLADLDWRMAIDPSEIENALDWGIRNSSSVIENIGAQKGLLSSLDI